MAWWLFDVARLIELTPGVLPHITLFSQVSSNRLQTAEWRTVLTADPSRKLPPDGNACRQTGEAADAVTTVKGKTVWSVLALCRCHLVWELKLPSGTRAVALKVPQWVIATWQSNTLSLIVIKAASVLLSIPLYFFFSFFPQHGWEHYRSPCGADGGLYLLFRHKALDVHEVSARRVEPSTATSPSCFCRCFSSSSVTVAPIDVPFPSQPR